MAPARSPRPRQRLHQQRAALQGAGVAPETLRFISGDFESMYPNIDTERALAAITSDELQLALRALEPRGRARRLEAPQRRVRGSLQHLKVLGEHFETS